MSDAYIITGMNSIVNPDNIKPGINLEELERKLIMGGLIESNIKEPENKFKDELQDMANKLGMSYGDFEKKSSGSFDQSHQSPKSSQGSFDQSHQSSKSSQSSFEQSYTRNSSAHNSDSDESESEEEEMKFSPIKNNFSNSMRFGSGELHTRTMEQERRAHIDSVMGDSAGSFSFEKEKREDMKCAMLAEIDSLMTSLKEESIDLSNVPRVDKNSPYEDVEIVLKTLRHKNDHSRYCSFAEEFLLSGAYALEELFDGQRSWMGYQPDLTGWHNHVNVKLKRMRHDTGQLVSAVMQDYNIGPGFRVLLELIPNMIIYSKMRKKQHGQPGLFSDDQMAAACRRLADA